MNPNLILHYRQPSLTDTRDNRHLLIWGDLAQWLVVDRELQAFLQQFNGRRSVAEIIRRQAQQQRRSFADVQQQALPIIAELRGRQLLATTAVAAQTTPEMTRIANVTINLTNRCNLRCRWCYNAVRRQPEAPIESLFDGLRRGRAVLAPDASFIILGGEPFLLPDRLLTAIDRARELFSQPVLVSTNGTLVTDAIVAELARRHCEIQVSIDSADPAEHDAGRGGGVFAQACNAVRRLVNGNVPCLMSMVFRQPIPDDLERYLDLAVSLGANEARFIPLRMIGRGLDCQAERPDLLRTFRDLLSVLDRRPELRPLLRRDYFTILMTVCRFSMPRSGCGVGRKVVFVDADGTVYPCPNHVAPQFVCGSLLQDDLETIISTSPVMQQLRAHCEVSRYDRCRDCAFRHWCAGDCRGEVRALGHDEAGPAPHCRELQQVMTEMFWLIADQDQRLGTTPDLPHGARADNAFVV